eukprot:CAMPEP_0203757136 /NCGR_PEP_ID=MMETSP0098-20131031/10273_1 /ASSEMBLY_ACC=CAM_ASM_000208 /TAXON_ID=96639 /ORGANISM=" , Strain NY0313808BC1" /LENGTH=495 /DNA_ID=CAMNT_0050649263 /DNA_START=415 /DNA_END=1902 /DNA_ORIENTATION=-
MDKGGDLPGEHGAINGELSDLGILDSFTADDDREVEIKAEEQRVSSVGIELKSVAERTSDNRQVSFLKSALKSSPSTVPTKFTPEELERRPYYEADFQVSEEVWMHIYGIVTLLRSSQVEDQATGSFQLYRLLGSEALFDNDEWLQVIIQRTIIEIKKLEAQTTDPQVSANVDMCISLIEERSNGLWDALLMDEENRREQIKNDWDGYMTHEEHMAFLHKKRLKMEENRRHLRNITALILVFLGVCSLCSFVAAGLFLSSWFVDHCEPAIIFTLSAAVVCLLALPTFNFMCLQYRYAPYDSSRKGLLAEFHSINVVMITYFAWIIVALCVLDFLLSPYDLCLGHMSYARYLIGVLSIIIGFAVVVRMINWLPRGPTAMPKCCVEKIWTPSLLRWYLYGFFSFKCLQPRFRSAESAVKHMNKYSTEVSLQARVNETDDPVRDRHLDIEDNFKSSTGCCKSQQRMAFRAAVKEYKLLQKVARAHATDLGGDGKQKHN